MRGHLCLTGCLEQGNPLEKDPLEAIDELSCDFSNCAGKISELADHYDIRAVAYRWIYINNCIRHLYIRITLTFAPPTVRDFDGVFLSLSGVELPACAWISGELEEITEEVKGGLDKLFFVLLKPSRNSRPWTLNEDSFGRLHQQNRKINTWQYLAM